MSSSFAKRRFLSMVLAALVIIVFLLYAPRGRPARAPFDAISSEFENEAVIGIVGSEPDIELELESEQYQPSNNANDAKNEVNENNANSANNPTTVNNANNANNANNPNNALAQKLLAPQPAMMYHNEHTLQYANYKQHTEAKLRELTACAIRGDCHPNADKVSGTRLLRLFADVGRSLSSGRFGTRPRCTWIAVAGRLCGPADL
jgi:hypothetical protein